MLEQLLMVLGVFSTLALIIYIDEKFGKRKQQGRGERCPVCGYLVDGPLHDEDRCSSEREVREMSPADIKTRRLFRMNEDELGF